MQSTLHYLREGYAWVGLTFKPLALDFLRGWDPNRYAPLSLPDDDGIAWDLASQVAALIRDAANPANPFQGYDVQRVYATGQSQPASFLVTYVNEFHPIAKLADGSDAYDGYLITARGTNARAINNGDNPGYDDERRFIRAGIGVPIIVMQSETDVFNSRQGDMALFRLWEVAGSSHGDYPRFVRA
jgi:hypothetical protein